jgi:ribosome recycling factor
MHDWKSRMRKTVEHLTDQLRGIRVGTVSAGFLASIRVMAGGNTRPLERAAAIRPQGDRFLIVPFEPADVPGIVRSLVEARLNAYALDPRTVSVSVPPISGEQRQELARHVKRLGEEAKVAVRAVRQQARKAIDSSGRGSLRVVQEATDDAVAEIELLVAAKVAEIGA